MSYNHQRAQRNPAYGGGSSSSSDQGPVGALTTLAEWAANSLDSTLRPPTRVEELVQRCCEPYLSEPNLSLNLELADYINRKKANTPREAAMEIVRKANAPSPHISMLALSLLDTLAKNCGYAFHLQIATKEFLNNLVRRFPERPPLFLTPYQTKILELIHEWKLTMCVTSKHKEDLVHIRDMHRLLSYKGYRFPNIDSRVQSVMNPENNLKSPDELEEEDREAQAAKLQELIRRGRPQDLVQAQELMKIMSGAEPENKPDYRAQTAKELDKVQSKAILLNDMLNNAKEGEKFVRDDAYDQVCTQLKSVQPRLQKWIEDAEEEESAHIDRLLLINDLINQVISRYAAYVKGDFSATVSIDPSIDPRKGGADAVPTAKITDLISFDDEGAVADAKKDEPGSNSLMDDFASLTFGPSSGSSNANPAQASSSSSNSGSGAFGGLAGLDMSKVSTPAGQGAISLGGSSMAQQGASGSRAPAPAPSDPFAAFGAPLQPTKPAGAASDGNGSQQANKPAAKSDPFADLDFLR